MTAKGLVVPVWYDPNFDGETFSALKGPVPSGSGLGFKPTAMRKAANASAEVMAVPLSVAARLAPRL